MTEPSAKDKKHFGAYLRGARLEHGVSLDELAQSTKVSKSTLAFLEEADFEFLPPPVFVRGFVKAYAKTLAIPDEEPLALLDEMLQEKRRQQEAATVLPIADQEDPLTMGLDGMTGYEDEMAPKRGVGLAVFVVIVLVIASITVSYLLRQPPAPGEGLSLGPWPVQVDTSGADRRG